MRPRPRPAGPRATPIRAGRPSLRCAAQEACQNCGVGETPDDVDRPAPLIAIQAAANLAAVGTGLALHGTSGGLAGALATPAVEQALTVAVSAIRDRRERRVKRVLSMAAKAAGISPQDLLSRLNEDPLREDLLVRTLTAAQDSALTEKLVALAISLVVGAKSDSSDEVAWESSFVRTLSELDASHLELLKAFPRYQDDPDSEHFRERSGELNLMQLRALLPALSDILDPTLATIERHGLVRALSSAAAPTYAQLSQADAFRLTVFGSGFLGRMKVVGESLTAD